MKQREREREREREDRVGVREWVRKCHQATPAATSVLDNKRMTAYLQ